MLFNEIIFIIHQRGAKGNARIFQGDHSYYISAVFLYLVAVD